MNDDLKRVNLRDIVDRISENTIVLPDFQRGFTWKENNRQKALLASVLTKLPIGTVLFLNVKTEDYGYKKIGKNERNIDNLEGKQEVKALLDGQQRITVLTAFLSTKLQRENIDDLVSPTLERRYFLNLPSFQSVINSKKEDLFGGTILSFPNSFRGNYPEISSEEMKERITFVHDRKKAFLYEKAETKDTREIREYCRNVNNSEDGDAYLLPLFYLLDACEPGAPGAVILEDVVKEIGAEYEKSIRSWLQAEEYPMGSNSIIKKFRSEIKGSGAVYDNLEAERKKLERDIEKLRDEIEVLEVNIRNYEKKNEDIERFLAENHNTEELQRKKKHLELLCESQRKQSLYSYKTLVNAISDKAYMVFARPMLRASMELLKSAKMERRDIPHMRQATIDYIIKSKRCICGHEVKKDSSEYFALMEQRNYLPPADVGSIIGDFERTANRWYRKGDELLEEIDDYAKEVDENVREYHDSCNRYEKLQKQLDEHIDFAEKRKTQRFYKSEIQRFSKEKGEKEGRIEACKKRIETTEKEMQSLEARNERNRIWRQRLEIAEELYQQLDKEFSEQENKIFLELNRQIQENFSKMFNAKDKKIELTPKYEIQMLYRTQQGYREEKNLSEGEKIARNFAFIVTIMDFSRRKKQEKTGHETADSDTLPIVLDGPFSKLGDENIELIAKVLPQVSEQVIIFMLKKDWEYTKLDPYVGSRYYIDKKPEESFATIKPAGEETV